MNMNRAFFLKKEQQAPKWRIFNAEGQILGRLATQLAVALRGKDKPEFTPNADAGDYVIVVNAEKIQLTGEKETKKEYKRHSGWIGGLKSKIARDVRADDPAQLIESAVKGMIPKNSLGRTMLKKLKVYEGSVHPHTAQCAQL